MSTYEQEFTQAMNRTRRFGLDMPTGVVDPSRRWLDAKAQAEFPYVVHEALGELGLRDVVVQCLAIHYRLLDHISAWLGCDVFYTIGWVDDLSLNGMFRFDEKFIAQKLRAGHSGGSVNIHAWLTLPSMEIVDVALSTSMGYVQKLPEMYGRVIARHPNELKDMAYKPMLVGDDFLRKTGLMLERPF